MRLEEETQNRLDGEHEMEDLKPAEPALSSPAFLLLVDTDFVILHFVQSHEMAIEYARAHDSVSDRPVLLPYSTLLVFFTSPSPYSGIRQCDTVAPCTQTVIPIYLSNKGYRNGWDMEMSTRKQALFVI